MVRGLLLNGMVCVLAGLQGGLPADAQAPPAALAPQAAPKPVPAPVSPTVPQRRFVVVLDAAHGGEDGGAQLAGSVAEKTVTLALSVRLRSLLTARGFSVVTTREGNVRVEPDVRAQIANRAGGSSGGGAAACLSLHATQTGSGVHIFVSSLAPAAPTRFLAWKTAQSVYVTRSLKLAGVVNGAFERGSDGGPIAASLARTNLPGMDSMTCPAVAIEMAPVRGSDGAIVTEVTDEQYQTQVVQALADALLVWRTDWESDALRPDLKAAGSKLP